MAQPKQTRLSFNPVDPAASGFPDKAQRSPGDRQATLRYGNPSLGTVRHRVSRLDFGENVSPALAVEGMSRPDHGDEKARDNGGKRKEMKKWKKGSHEKRSKRDKKPIVVDEDGSESDVEIVPPSRSARNGANSLKRKRPTESEEEGEEHSEASDEDEVVSRPRRKLRRGAARESVVLSDDVNDNDADAHGKPEKQDQDQDQDEDEDEDEPVIATPARRKRNTVPEDPQTPRRDLDQDKLDIEEDLADLQDSVVKETRTRGRVANSARSKRQQHLEALRRRRAGDKPKSATISEDEQEIPEEASEGSEEEPLGAPAPYQTRLNGAQADSDAESAIPSDEDLDRYDEDFISEDEQDALGVPTTGLEDMPLEFTRHAYKQTKEYFRDAVEWMVHNQLNPAFPRSAPLYKVAFKKLEDEVKGRTGSQLVSSVWNAGFHRALMARPHIEVTAFPIGADHPCDACNRSGHPASSDVKLYGKAYSLDTLEALSDDDSDDEETDLKEKDRDGNVLPDENTRFYLGRTCKTRASMAHTLTHWRFHLNGWVTGYLEQTGHLGDANILERSHWSQKRKSRFAAEVVMMMDESGEVKKLWRDFHINLKAARESADHF